MSILTVEDFFHNYSNNTSLAEGYYEYLVDKEDFKEASIEFAKLHVQEALKQASEKAKTKTISKKRCLPGYSISVNKEIIDKNSILNAYPLENIK